MLNRQKMVNGYASCAPNQENNIEVIRGVLSGFSLDEESRFIAFHQSNRLALVKGFALISFVLYFLLGIGAHTLLPDLERGIWLMTYQSLVINWVVMLAFIFLAQTRPYYYLSVAICAHFSIAWTVLAAFRAEGWASVFLVLGASWMTFLVYGSGALLFRYSVLSCFSVGVTVMVIARLFNIELQAIWFVYLFLGTQAFGMLLGVCQEYWSRQYYLSVGKLGSENQKLIEEIEALQLLANQDRTTGLPALYGFQKTLTQYWLDSQRTEKPLGMLLIHIKDYQSLESRCTSIELEELVRACGHCLKNCASHSGDYLARFEQGTFSCLLPDTDQQGVERVAAYMTDVVSRARIALPGNGEQDQTLEILISGVCASGDACDEQAIEFLKQATDRLMHLVSAEGVSSLINQMETEGKPKAC